MAYTTATSTQKACIYIVSGCIGIIKSSQQLTLNHSVFRPLLLQSTVNNHDGATGIDITCDSTPSFRRNVTAYPNSPNDFAKFELDSYFLQNASASKMEIEIENCLTIF